MMLFHGFKSKAALKTAIALAESGAAEPVLASECLEETSMFGSEYKSGTKATYCVCLDHPKRTKFANVTVNESGIVCKVA